LAGSERGFESARCSAAAGVLPGLAELPCPRARRRSRRSVPGPRPRRPRAGRELRPIRSRVRATQFWHQRRDGRRHGAAHGRRRASASRPIVLRARCWQSATASWWTRLRPPGSSARGQRVGARNSPGPSSSPYSLECPTATKNSAARIGPIPGRLRRTRASGRAKKRCLISSSMLSRRSLRPRTSPASSATTMREATYLLLGG
jgi:hypothetical protein